MANKTYNTVQEIQAKNQEILNNDSQAVCYIVNNFIKNKTETETIALKLEKVIKAQYQEIKDLKYKLDGKQKVKAE